jgi:hypothetical protein
MVKKHLLIATLFLAMHSSAQQTGRMEADRPDQTESPFTVKHKYFQVETGIGLIKDNKLSTIILPTVLTKYGLLKNLELRLVTEFNVVETPVIIPFGNDFVSGLTPVKVGGKLGLFEEKGWLPKTSVIFEVGIPKAASKKFRATKWAPAFILTMQNSLSENVGLGYNLGAEWDGETNKPYTIYTISAGFDMGKQWTSFIEFFGAARKNNPPANTIDLGLGYYINDNIKLDVSGGAGVSRSAADGFFSAGFSIRFR